MKKSIFLFFAAILCAMSVSAKTIYLNTGGSGLWNQAGAWFAMYLCNGSEDAKWYKMTAVPNVPDVYQVDVDDALLTVAKNKNVIFARRDPANTNLDWNGVWNQTADLDNKLSSNNCYTITGWGGTDGSWSTYTPPTTAPEYYLTGTLAGGWNANDIKMTYDEATETYSHTFTAVAAGELHQFKVTDGTWGNSWGGNAVSPAIEGVTNGSDGNVAFTLSTGGDVTITFKDFKIQLTTTGSFTPVETFDYYVVGSFNGWNNADPAYGMTKDGDVYKKEVTFAAAVEFKVCDGTWDAAWGAGNFGDNKYKELDGTDNIVMKEEKTFTIIFNPAQNLLTFEGLTAEAVVKYDYYIAGTENLTGYNWSANGLGMTKDGDVYKHTFTELPDGEYQFKITDGQWNSEGDNTHEHTTLGATYEEVSYSEGNIKIVTDEAINLTVIFDAANDKITFEGLNEITEGLTYTVETPWGTEECYFASATTGWNFRQMEPTDEEYVFTITIVGAKETDEYKYACKADWDFAEVREADENGNTNRKAWTEKDVVDEWATLTYTVAGDNTAVFGAEWDVEIWENNMTLQEHDGTYVWTKPAVYLAGNVEFKVIKNHNWDTAWPTENYVINITESAYYSLTIYYNPANNDITVVTNKLTAQTASLTMDGVVLEEMEFNGMNLLSLSGATSDWTSDVYIFLENYTGEDKAYDVYLESSISYNYNYSMYQSVSGQLTQTTDADGIRTFTGTLNVVFEGYDEATDAMVAQPYELTVTLVEKTDEATLVVVTDATVTLDAGLTMTGEWTDEYDGTTYPVLVTVPGFDQSVASAELDASITVGGEGEYDPWLGWVEGLTTVTVEDGDVTVAGVLENVWARIKLEVSISGTLPVVEEPDPDPTPDPEPTPDYTRTVGNNQFGTICLPFGGTITGAVLYECVGKEEGKVYLGSVTTLTAGVPYIFQATATATELAVYSDGTTATEAGSSNGLHGTFEDETEVAAGNYILLGNTLYPSDGEAKVNANRAYLDMSGVPAGVPTQMPGRRYIGMSVQGENGATGVEDLFTTEAPVKVIENGQLIIIRDGVKYNVQGQVIR